MANKHFIATARTMLSDFGFTPTSKKRPLHYVLKMENGLSLDAAISLDFISLCLDGVRTGPEAYAVTNAPDLAMAIFNLGRDAVACAVRTATTWAIESPELVLNTRSKE